MDKLLQFNLHSTGTFASNDTVQNGTESAIELSFNPFYFIGGLIYRSQIILSNQLETKMNAIEDILFDVINQD